MIFKNLATKPETKHYGAFLDLSGRLAFFVAPARVLLIFFKAEILVKSLVVCTVNDISMCGAEPKYLSLSFIIEEGFAMEDLKNYLIV